MTDEIPTEFEPKPISSIFDKPIGNRRKQTSDGVPKQGTRGRPNKHNQRKEKLQSLLGTVGSAVCMFELHDGSVIIAHAEAVAEATATLADENVHVAKAIDSMSVGGAWGGFMLALASMIIPILVHHNLVPAFLTAITVPPPDISASAS